MTSAGRSLGEVGETGVLHEVFGALAGQPSTGVVVGPGDDTALLRVRAGGVLATTDTMVRGRDWRDEWSCASDVGVKVVTQNLADIAAMGGVGTGLLVTLVAHPGLALRWARELTEGVAAAASDAGVPVIGGDLSSAPEGVVVVSVTALGELADDIPAPVLRSGATDGQVLAVSGPLGRSGTGWSLLRAGVLEPRTEVEALALAHHRRPRTDLAQGPEAARAGATAMLDVSDGLVRDGDRIARTSGVRLDLDPVAVRSLADLLAPAVGGQAALQQVLGGGEEHELLATFPSVTVVPQGWFPLGSVTAADRGDPGDPGASADPGGPGDPDGRRTGVWLDGHRLDPSRGGWDHFGG